MITGLQTRIYSLFARNIRRVGRDITETKERSALSLA